MPAFGAAAFRTAQNKHVDLVPADSIGVGQGYWIRSTKKFASLSLPPLRSKSPSGAKVRIRLDSGWNLIGNPYAQTLYWPYSRKAGNYKLSKIKAPWAFSHEEEDYRGSDSLVPWRGYFVYSYAKDTAVELSSYPIQAHGKTAAGAAGFGEYGISLQYGRRAPVEIGVSPMAKAGLGLEDELALPALASKATLVSLRQGRGLRADYQPPRTDSAHRWTLVARNPNPQARPEELRVAAFSLPPGFEAWIVAPGRKVKQALRSGGPGFQPAPGADTLIVLAGSREVLENSGLLRESREGSPGFGMRVLPRSRDFLLRLDLPAQAWVEARLVDLRGRTVAATDPKWLGAGHHQLSFAAHFRLRGAAPGRGIYLLWLRHRGEGLPAQSVSRIHLSN
jgi:hypothetical protein